MIIEASVLQSQRITNQRLGLKRYTFHFFILFIIGITLWFYVWTRIQVLRYHYTIVSISKTERHVLEEHKRLRLKLANLNSPHRLEYIAKNQLNLKLPQQEQLIYLK